MSKDAPDPTRPDPRTDPQDGAAVAARRERRIILAQPPNLNGLDSRHAEEVRKSRQSIRRRVRPMDKPTNLKDVMKWSQDERRQVFESRPQGRLDPRDFEPPPVDENGEPILPKELSPSERARQRRDALVKLFGEKHLTLDDLEPFRVRVCWRLVREMARVRGLLQPDDPLTDLEPWMGNIDPWLQPERWSEPRNIEAFGAIPDDVISLIQHAERLPDEFCYSIMDIENPPQRIYFPGLALLPPPVPFMWLDDGSVREDYDPEGDAALNIYIALLRACAENLHIWNGSKFDRDEGRYGMQGLLDPHLIRLAFPSRMELIMWEQMLVEETMKQMVEFGIPQAMRHLKDRYGLVKHEQLGLVRMARMQAAEITEADVEDDRAVMVLRLESVIKTAREALDLKAELQALKMLGIVQGLGRTDPNDALQDFIDVVKEVSADRQQKALPSGQPPLLE